MLRGGSNEVSIISVVYPRKTVSVSPIGYFSFVCSSYKPSHTSIPLSLVVHYIQEYFNNNRRGRKTTSIHRRRSPGTSIRGIK